jgi:teichuronic acid biosynthesis glycosyltransferase TuaC
MRIALVTTSWPADDGDPSGHFVQAEARELEREGHAVEIVAPAPGGAFGWPGVAARVREKPWRAFDAVRWTVRARAQVARLDVDRVVAHWVVPCGWPIALQSPAELHLVSHGGDVRLLLGLPSLLRARIVRDVTARATVWRFVSESLRASLLAELPSDLRARVEAIALVRPASLDVPDVRDAIARRRRELAGTRVAVSVGRLVPSKRVDRAIDHVARVRDVDALVIVGDGPERERLVAHARRRGVDARFVGVVPRTEALAWIGVADHVLFASEAEGRSTVVREAEALGTRVVVVGPE